MAVDKNDQILYKGKSKKYPAIQQRGGRSVGRTVDRSEGRGDREKSMEEAQQQQYGNINNNLRMRRSLVIPNNRSSNASSSFRLGSPSLNLLRLRRIFDIFDKNGDGIITVEEISRALNLLGLDADLSELHSIISSFIRPGNFGLSYQDFEALHLSLGDSFFIIDNNNSSSTSNMMMMMMKSQEEQEDSDLSEAFKVFDEDGDGFISAKELQVVLSKLGLPEASEMDRVRQMILSVDTNHDGRVDFCEFKNMMRRSAFLVPSS